MRRGDRLYTLDGLRGIAAILVLLTHLEPLVRLAPGGYLAVDFFFALSGVVIAENYGPRLRAGLGWRAFMRMRVIRLYPLFAVGLVLGLGRATSQVILHQPTALPPAQIALAFVLGLAMLPSVAAFPALYPLLSPAWTLLLELLANATYAVAPRTRRLGAGMVLCGASAVGLWLVKRPDAGLNLGVFWPMLPMGLMRVGYGFTVGVLLYELVLRKSMPRSSRLAPLPILAAATLMLVDVPGQWRGPYDWACIVLAVPVLVWLSARWNAAPALRAPFEALGDLSYPLYTIHYPLVFAATYAARRFALAPALWVPCLLAVLLPAALLLGRRVDPPARRALGQLIASREGR